jgi:four helix bundle protein
MSGTYKDLKAWQAAMDLVVDIYHRSSNFPKDEIYGLTSQVRRAAVSIASNIAEGKGRSSDKEFVQFLNHARGSLFEVETQVAIADRLTLIPTQECGELLNRTAELGRILNGLIKAIGSNRRATNQA